MKLFESRGVLATSVMERQKALKESMKRSALPAPPVLSPPPTMTDSKVFRATLIPEDHDDGSETATTRKMAGQGDRPLSTASSTSTDPNHLSMRTAVSIKAGEAKKSSDKEMRELQKGKVFPENVVQCLQILVNALAATELCEHMPSEKDPHVRWYSKAPGLGSIDHGRGGGR